MAKQTKEVQGGFVVPESISVLIPANIADRVYDALYTLDRTVDSNVKRRARFGDKGLKVDGKGKHTFEREDGRISPDVRLYGLCLIIAEIDDEMDGLQLAKLPKPVLNWFDILDAREKGRQQELAAKQREAEMAANPPVSPATT